MESGERVQCGEGDLAERVIALARGVVSADELADIEANAAAGEVECAVSYALEYGTPIDEELAAEIRTAWIDGRAWDDRPVRRARLARALTAAGFPTKETTTPVQDYAERLLDRERAVADDQTVRFWDGLATSREFALLAEQLTVRSIKRGSLTDTDRADALALPGLRGIHWRL